MLGIYIIAQVSVSQGSIRVGVGILWVEAEGLVVVLDGPLGLSEVVVSITTVDVG